MDARALWIPAFLEALAKEAENGLQFADDPGAGLVRGPRRNRRRAQDITGRRCCRRARGRPLVSAISLGRVLGMAVKNGAELLDAFCADGIAIEVTHRPSVVYSASLPSLLYATRWRHHAGRNMGEDEGGRRFIQPRKR